jgi:hypothetical protein
MIGAIEIVINWKMVVVGASYAVHALANGTRQCNCEIKIDIGAGISEDANVHCETPRTA